MNAKISTTFIGRDPDAAFITDSGRILTMLDGNVHFGSTKPALAVIVAQRDAFIAAVEALNRSPASVTARDVARLPLEQSLRELALYVQQTAKGDRGILLSSGFPLQKGRQPAGKPGTPHNLRLRQGNSGQIIARCNRVDTAKSYQWRFAPSATPTAYQQQEPTTRATATLVGLVPGTQYYVQVRAVGTKGASDWCDAAVLFVN